MILLYGWWLWWRGARDGGPAEAKVHTDGGASADADSGALAHAGAAAGAERSAEEDRLTPLRGLHRRPRPEHCPSPDSVPRPGSERCRPGRR